MRSHVRHNLMVSGCRNDYLFLQFVKICRFASFEENASRIAFYAFLYWVRGVLMIEVNGFEALD